MRLLATKVDYRFVSLTELRRMAEDAGEAFAGEPSGSHEVYIKLLSGLVSELSSRGY
jgi:hypothetical protein